MFIDIHTHAYRIKPPFVCNFCTPDELIARYDEEGIERGCVLPIVSPEIYFPQANEDILEMAQQYPDRIIPWCNVDPRLLTNSPKAPLGKVLAHYKDAGCKGLGEVMLNVPMMDPMVQNLFAHAEDVGLPVTFDGSDQVGGDFGLYDDPGLPQLEHTLQTFPKLVILGHGPTFWAEISGEVPRGNRSCYPSGPVAPGGAVPRLMRRYPNMWADISAGSGHTALTRDPSFGIEFLDEFQDKLMFGTDSCRRSDVNETYMTVSLIRDLRANRKLSEDALAQIEWRNATELLGLDAG